MSSDLRDRLSDLAAHTPAAVPPPDLWDRGVRRRRLDRAVTAGVVVALLALFGLGGVTWHASRAVQPVDSQGSPHLPDRFFYDVSPWTHTFDGPPGPLVTVFPAVRKTVRHTTNGIIGVTASTGAHGFLDLPDDAVGSSDINALALSPDGRHVAFWITGTPSGSPNTTMVAGETITGIAVYDAVDGQVRESRIATVHGIEPRALLWADDSTLLLTYGQIQGGDGTERATSSSFGASAVWPIGSAHPQVLREDAFSTSFDSSVTRATDGEVVTHVSRRWLVADASDPTAVRSFRLNRAPELLVPSPDRRRVIGVLTHRSNTGPLVLARMPPDGERTTLRPLPFGNRSVQPLAWLDDDHVAVFREVVVRDPVEGPFVSGRLDAVDLTTGTARHLVAGVGSHGTSYADAWIATGLLGAPSVHADPPPSPPDLRAWTIGIGVGAALVLFLGLLLLRGTRVRGA